MSRRTGQPNLRDVATQAGVSSATVSRALNDPDSVSAQSRERVLQAVTELGYRPNNLARSLRRQQVDMIGVVVSDIENIHFAQMVRTIEDAAYRMGYRVILCNTDEQAQKQASYLEMLAAEHVRGIIIAPSSASAPEITQLLDRGIPVVACDREIADTRAGSVIADNEGGARRATEHLLNAGHTRIGLVGGPPSIQTGLERQAGYEAAMRARGLRPQMSVGGFRVEGGRRATDELLAAHSDLTGLVIANNLMAIGALQALKRRGLRVPRDLAVVSIDDPIWAEVTDPPLTTLAQPIKEMARAAVDLLFQRINGEPNPPRRVVFDLELRVRASSGTKSVEGEVE